MNAGGKRTAEGGARTKAGRQIDVDSSLKTDGGYFPTPEALVRQRMACGNFEEHSGMLSDA